MNNFFYDAVLWMLPLAVSFYTMTYARWLLDKKNKKGAAGVALLAVITAIYPGFVLFFIHR